MIDHKPLVSIIINCFNGEKYLRKCLESVINQKYQNWEIIFWDNLSTDNSEKIVQSFNDKRIKYFKGKEFTTLYSARNLAIKKISGNFICFLDVDDWWLPEKIYQQVNFFKENKNIEILYSNFFNYYEAKKLKRIFSKEILPSGKITQELINHYKIGILTVMVKSSILLESSFNENYEIISDFDFFTNLSLKKNISAIQTPLAYYRIHEQNLSKKKFDQQIQEMEDWYFINKSNFLGYSLKGIELSLQVLKIKKYLFSGEKIKVIREILKKPIGLKKFKFLLFIVLSKKKIIDILG